MNSPDEIIAEIKRRPKTRVATIVVSLIAVACVVFLVSIKKEGSATLRADSMQNILSLSFTRSHPHEPLSSSEDDGGDFTIASSAFDNNGDLPDAYTCDGTGGSPPLYWNNAPSDTVEYLIYMWSKGDEKDNNPNCIRYSWLLYNIDSSVTSLSAGDSRACNSEGVCGGTYPSKPYWYYASPCSQGGGYRTYHFTIYALGGSASDILADVDDDHKRIAPYVLASVRRSQYVLGNSTITATFCHTACSIEATDDDYYNEDDDAAEDCVDLDDALF